MARPKTTSLLSFAEAEADAAAALAKLKLMKQQRAELVGRVMIGYWPAQQVIASALEAADLSQSDRALVLELLHPAAEPDTHSAALHPTFTERQSDPGDTGFTAD